jgi:hypothetical protein
MNSQDKALQDLQFIRNTMERSAPLTSVSGYGLMAMGAVATIGAYVAAFPRGAAWWANTWTAVAVVAFLLGVLSTWVKAKRSGTSVFAGPGKRFLLALAPPIVAGTVLSQVFFMNGHMALMPGTWLLLYGAGVITGGAFSVRLIPMMGIVFMGLGCVALFLSPSSLNPMLLGMSVQDILLAIGFGGVHILFGGVIAARYGG